MKKIIALFISLLVLGLGLGVSATSPVREAAAGGGWTYPVEFSEDYNEIYYNGITYFQFNGNNLVYDEGCTEVYADLTAEQLTVVSQLRLEISTKENFLWADYSLDNGGTMSFAYMRREYIESYNRIKTDDWSTAEINFYWPDDNIIITERSALSQNKTNISPSSYVSGFESFEVYTPIEGQDFGIIKGQLVIADEKYYYVDFANAGITYNDSFYLGDYSSVSAYEITDKALCGEIDTAITEYYDDGLGFLENDKLTNSISDVLLCILFGVFPLAVLVLFLVLAIRSKTKYKRLFRAIYLSAMLVLALFVAMVIIL